NLPVHAPLVPAPAAHALLPAVADDGVPVAVGLRLVVGGHLEGEGLAVLELEAAIQADAGDAHHGELHHDGLALLAVGVVARRGDDGADVTVGEHARVEAGGFLGVVVVPDADGVFGSGHGEWLRYVDGAGQGAA